MAEICLKTDSGEIIALKSVNILSGEGTVLVHCDCVLRPSDSERIEKQLSENLDRKVVVLDKRVSRVELFKAGD